MRHPACKSNDASGQWRRPRKLAPNQILRLKGHQRRQAGERRGRAGDEGVSISISWRTAAAPDRSRYTQWRGTAKRLFVCTCNSWHRSLARMAPQDPLGCRPAPRPCHSMRNFATHGGTPPASSLNPRLCCTLQAALACRRFKSPRGRGPPGTKTCDPSPGCATCQSPRWA